MSEDSVATWKAHDLIPGRAYESIHFGTVKYVGLDHFHGQTTHAFEVGRMQYRYWSTEKLHQFLLPPPEPLKLSTSSNLQEIIDTLQTELECLLEDLGTAEQSAVEGLMARINRIEAVIEKAGRS